MKEPRIVLVTNEQPHHYYWIYKLENQLNVTGIILPQVNNRNGNPFKLIKKKKLLLYGVRWLILKVMSLIYNKLNFGSFSHDLNAKNKKYYNKYKELISPDTLVKIKKVDSINSAQGVAALKEMEPDFICFLGGDIARAEALNCAKIATLNYHSGLSPFYNGTKTIFQAVSDIRPNLAGGTLMYMNERIDGGGILAHYLPAIAEKDTAADLFLKGIDGSVKLYLEFFRHISQNNLPPSVEQQRSFRFLRNIDWTIVQDIRLRWVYKNGIMKRYSREEVVINHFDLGRGDFDELIKRISKKTLYK